MSGLRFARSDAELRMTWVEGAFVSMRVRRRLNETIVRRREAHQREPCNERLRLTLGEAATAAGSSQTP